MHAILHALFLPTALMEPPPHPISIGEVLMPGKTQAELVLLVLLMSVCIIAAGFLVKTATTPPAADAAVPIVKPRRASMPARLPSRRDSMPGSIVRTRAQKAREQATEDDSASAESAPTLAMWLSQSDTKFALALSPGFFGYYAHIGALQALDDAGLLEGERCCPNLRFACLAGVVLLRRCTCPASPLFCSLNQEAHARVIGLSAAMVDVSSSLKCM